jgi:predicted phosphodiesterase
MRYFRLVSDLHFKDSEHRFNPPELDDDWRTILLVAGDLGHKDRAIEWFHEMSQRFAHVVVVLGNHDFYNYDQYDNYSKEFGSEHDTFSEKWHYWQQQLAALEHVHLLENEVIELNDVRIIGATLWSDFLDDPFIMRTAQLNMADYRLILDDETKEPISPRVMQTKHRNSVCFIEQALKETAMPSVVITHHAPTWQSITSQNYLEDELTHAYNSNLDELIKRSSASLWVYGHTHNAHQVMIGDTMVMTNPYGFVGEYTGYEMSQQIVIDDQGQCHIKEEHYS